MDTQGYLETTTMRSIMGIPTAQLDAVMATAFQLYQAGRYQEVEILCRGLIAADHLYWWAYSLYGATLHRLGCHEEALAQVDRGLVFEPGQPKLLLLRGRILAALGRTDEARADLIPLARTGRPADQAAAARELAQMEAA